MGKLPPYLSLPERLWHYGFRLLCGLIFFFLIFPLVVVIPLSFNAVPFFTFTKEMLALDPAGYSLKWYEDFFTNLNWQGAVQYSVIIAFFAGIRSNHLLLALFFLSFTTICFGWVTEALSRPDAESRVVDTDGERIAYGFDPLAKSRHTRWEINARNRDLLVVGCLPVSSHLLAAVQRLGPHLLGCPRSGARYR